MKGVLSLLFVTALAPFLFSEETKDPVEEGIVLPRPVTPEYKLSLELLEKICRHYVQHNSTADAEKTWREKWDKRVKEALEEDAILNENMYTNNWVLNWLTPRRNYTEKDITPTDKLQACRLFLLYMDKGLQIPEYIKEGINFKAVQIALELAK